MTTHELKVWREFFPGLLTGAKSFEIRKDDRNYQAGDVIILKEYDSQTSKYTGEQLERRIWYKIQGGQFGIEEGFCVLGIGELTRKYIELVVEKDEDEGGATYYPVAYLRVPDLEDPWLEETHTLEQWHEDQTLWGDFQDRWEAIAKVLGLTLRYREPGAWPS